MISPRVSSFMSSNVNSSCSSVISVNIIRIKTHNWAVLLVSVGSSNYSGKHSTQSAIPLQSCWIKSSAMTSQRCVTVLLDIWRAMNDDNISIIWNKESAASRKACFIILALNKGKQTKQRKNGAPVSPHGGNSSVQAPCTQRGWSNRMCTLFLHKLASRPVRWAWMSPMSASLCFISQTLSIIPLNQSQRYSSSG